MFELRRSRFWNVYVCILWLSEGDFEGPPLSYMGWHSSPDPGVKSLEAVEYTIRDRGKFAARVGELSVSRDSSIISTHEGRKEAY